MINHLRPEAGALCYKVREAWFTECIMYSLQDGNPPLDPSEHFMAEEEKLTDQERSKRWVRNSIHPHKLKKVVII